ncbi:GNAT family N-acetyltransferase [Lacticaseibacillus sharpeae]|uniref:N-acetyltransferase domain-containing protein n=1 Tax=Lacticaseibacillus sharpeae JCM 1186 = DSM 20505 TaxID=1291052 RepID=A0A0R1ZNV8_9LACO|nr:GNAT family N-acetyltransferase [Lacticaseibacillus sharpeae]KRM56138.1 hypothetical protein FC18_GL000668 [Lacticaseibacillus sharpeae JCM 1186 = DSM 20505]
MLPITTDRLILRPFTEADLPEFYAIQADLEVNRFLPWFAPKTEAEALIMLQERYLAPAAGYQLAVCLRSTNKAVGYIGVDADESHDLGYGMRRDAWGHGYMTEAAAALIAALPVADYPYLTATHDVQNPRSGAVMQRLGMQYQYTYLEQWQPKDIPVHFRLYLLNRDGDSARKYLKYWSKYPYHLVEKGLH